MKFKFEGTQRREIAGRTRTLQERIEDRDVHEEEPPDGTSIQETLSE